MIINKYINDLNLCLILIVLAITISIGGSCGDTNTYLNCVLIRWLFFWRRRILVFFEIFLNDFGSELLGFLALISLDPATISEFSVGPKGIVQRKHEEYLVDYVEK